MPDPEIFLEVAHVAKSFGGVRAVVDGWLSVPKGTTVGLIGPNGAGKSTMIEMISGFLAADGGKIILDGEEIQGKPAHQVAERGLIRTFQTPREWRGLTVMENMLLAADQKGRDAAWRAIFNRRRLKAAEQADRTRARELLERFGLLALRDEFAGSLSGGQKRLLEFARIAMRSPRMVLLDEPCAGVNPVLQRNIEEAIVGLQQDGITVLLVEHNLPFVERACNDIYVMAMGTTIAQGSLADLRKVPVVIDAYLGEVEAIA
ncbi:MAG: ABC transporter ATP-binding protein [Candidatus Dormibacteraeota bacterium]|nr:ABC transporter ATP-binding protein [Candidatus Dormibacteraeota bacterium]